MEQKILANDPDGFLLLQRYRTERECPDARWVSNRDRRVEVAAVA